MKKANQLPALHAQIVESPPVVQANVTVYDEFDSRLALPDPVLCLPCETVQNGISSQPLSSSRQMRPYDQTEPTSRQESRALHLDGDTGSEYRNGALFIHVEISP
ncbi:hypothetical protein AB8Z38_15595 [Bradyrhizobium sp. LLZ17]|uniref:Uncharacterized protein n=1 Tax=Bradyrhizobium sp. LLZ17 TaxID=3239388 RepID=A0AB39XV45_9BRAD